MKKPVDLGYRQRHARAAIERHRDAALAQVNSAAAEALERIEAANIAREGVSDGLAIEKAENVVVFDFQIPKNWPPCTRLSVEFAGGIRTDVELVKPIVSGVWRRAFLLVFPGDE